MCRLAYNGAVAAGQLAVFQGASDSSGSASGSGGPSDNTGPSDNGDPDSDPPAATHPTDPTAVNNAVDFAAQQA